MMLKAGKFVFVCMVMMVLLGACAAAPPPYQEDINVANLDPVPLGTLDIGIIRLFSNSVELMQVPLLYNPRTDAITLEFRVQTTHFRQFWSRQMRETFIRTLAEYEADYAARNLPRGSTNKMGRAYATMRAKTEWWLFTITTEYQGFPLMDVGYSFQNGSPYFTVTQRKTKDVRESITSRQTSSLNIVLYFTRAMAQDLAALFNEDHIYSLIPERYRVDNPVEDYFAEPVEAAPKPEKPLIPVEVYDAP
jgi:hypothetical protein